LGERWLFGYEAAAVRLNIGPGRDTRFASADQVYTPGEAPGIDRQSHYLASGPVIAYDYRDRTGLPHRGGLYTAQMFQYWDRSSGNFSFRRVRFSAEQYIPFLNEKRVIALRARTDLSFTGSGAVPFYLQPTIGGPDDVRGLDRFRYTANNATVLNAEYRWEVAQTLDIATFVDAGNVYARPGLIGFRDMKTAAGIGFRVKTRDAVVLRMDAGASREGFRLWVTFGNVF
jgi:outer membrane protein assembly factor BamA